MNKAVMLSIKPKWCDLIASGKKTIEVRKNRPKLNPPFKCYIYCSDGPMMYSEKVNYGRKMVIGEFVCDRIFPINVFLNGTIQDYMFNNLEASCVPYDDIVFYIGNGCRGDGWHISDLVIYDKPKELGEFYVEKDATTDYPMLVKMRRPPQSWCYVEGLGGGSGG